MNEEKLSIKNIIKNSWRKFKKPYYNINFIINENNNENKIERISFKKQKLNVGPLKENFLNLKKTIFDDLYIEIEGEPYIQKK